METVSVSEVHENNNLVSEKDVQLLETLEAANRLIEADAKSLNSLSNVSCSGTTGDSGSTESSNHSRKSSDTSLQASMSGQEGSGGDQENWLQWGRIINDWDAQWRKRPQQIKEMVRRGIPHHFRGIAWQLLCGAHNSVEKAKYAYYIRATSACEKSIRRDIARTYPEHEFFKEKDGMGQESLFNVMKSYSLHDREVGYCQGTAFIVGILLMQMPEEESFAVLVRIMYDYRMREMFKPSMAELGVCIHQLEVLIQEQLPELYGHFVSQSFHTSMFASSWFLTVFTTSLPLPLAARVMDCFLADGVEVIFRLAIAILHVGQTEILSLDMEGMLRYFQKEMPIRFEADPEKHFSLAQSVKYNAKRMKKLEKEYLAAKTKEHEDQIELRRLRTENRLLRQQVEYLEAESSSLADRLLQGQVCRAEEAEHSYVIRRELEAVRHHSLATADELDQARQRIEKLSQQMNTTTGSDDSLQELSLKAELLQQKEELIRCLQDQLVTVRLDQAEGEALITELHRRVDGLEEELRAAKKSSADEQLEVLQQKLTAVEHREGEALQSLEQLRSAVADLNIMWKRHLEEKEKLKMTLESSGGGGDAHQTSMRTPTAARRLLSWASGADESGRLRDELMTSRLAETEAQAELKQCLATALQSDTQISVTQNQLKRQSEELKECRELLHTSQQQNKQQATEFRELQRRFSDLQGKMKEELMLARIRDAEHTQYMNELTQNLCHLELKNQEVLAESELNGETDSCKARELCDKVADLKAQVCRMRSVSRSSSGSGYSTSHTTLSGRVSIDSVCDDELPLAVQRLKSTGATDLC